jgi:hypothetical protein
MHKVSSSAIDAGVRDKPYDEKSYLVSAVRKVFPERGDRDRSGPYGQGLIQFYTEGMKRTSHGFGHTVDIADIILIE